MYRFTQLLVQNVDLRQKIAAQGRLRAEQMFQWGRSLSDLVGYYREAIEMHQTTPTARNRQAVTSSESTGSFLRQRMLS